mmetsp:Transcript_78790/g.197974  ORF Transcript_78790/g.197974 Transcript_78790/m.197974 type:complete len:225 (-) Transcript_78790:1889-2563(-)
MVFDMPDCRGDPGVTLEVVLPRVTVAWASALQPCGTQPETSTSRLPALHAKVTLPSYPELTSSHGEGADAPDGKSSDRETNACKPSTVTTTPTSTGHAATTETSMADTELATERTSTTIGACVSASEAACSASEASASAGAVNSVTTTLPPAAAAMSSDSFNESSATVTCCNSEACASKAATPVELVSPPDAEAAASSEGSIEMSKPTPSPLRRRAAEHPCHEQ